MGQNNAGFRSPSPDDKFIDYNTFLMLFRHAIASGDMDLVTTDTTGADQPLVALAIVESRVQKAGQAGKIPDDTEVVMYKATEAKWDSSVNKYVAVSEGMEFDGVDQNFLRLVGQPGFSDTSYNNGPLLNGAIVPIYRIPENAEYGSPGDVAADIKVFDWSWQIVYLGDDPVVHPFKVTVDIDIALTVVVGYMRDHVANAGTGADAATKSHIGPDKITLMKDGAAPVIIDKTTTETLLLTGASGTNVYVYYEIDTDADTATLKQTAAWPPSSPATPSDTIFWPLAYCRLANPGGGVEISTIGQLQFGFITVPDGAGGGGTDTFIALLDTPSAYTDEAGKFAIVNQDEDALIFKNPPTISFWAVSELDKAAMAAAHSVVKEDLSLFKALTTPICGDDPPITLTVTGAGSETVNWGGHTWELPGASGVSVEVCPTTYIENLGASPDSTHEWQGEDIFIDRYKEAQFFPSTVQTGTQLRQRVQLVPSVDASSVGFNSYFNYFHDIAITPSTTSTYYSKATQLSAATPSPYPANNYGVGTVNDTRKIPDEFFTEWTDNGITFKVARTDPSDWPE